MTKDEALDLALEALKKTQSEGYNLPGTAIEEAIAAIKQVRALDKKADNARELGLDYEPAQLPVAYAVYHRMGGSKSLHWPDQHSPDGDASEYQLVPLYTATQPAQRTWQGLTDEEIEQCMKQAYATVQGRQLEHAFARATETAHNIKENT